MAYALDKQDRIEIAEASSDVRHRSALERIDRQQEHRAQLMQAQQDFAAQAAKIDGEYAVRLRELDLEHAPQTQALDYRYFALRHELLLEEIEEREIVSTTYRVIENIVAHNLKMAEERQRVRLEIELAEMQERHRENERLHEVLRDRLAMERDSLQSQLRNAEFSHLQAISRIEIPLKIRELGLSEGSRPSEEDVAAWVEALKRRGAL